MNDKYECAWQEAYRKITYSYDEDVAQMDARWASEMTARDVSDLVAGIEPLRVQDSGDAGILVAAALRKLTEALVMMERVRVETRAVEEANRAWRATERPYTAAMERRRAKR